MPCDVLKGIKQSSQSMLWQIFVAAKSIGNFNKAILSQDFKQPRSYWKSVLKETHSQYLWGCKKERAVFGGDLPVPHHCFQVRYGGPEAQSYFLPVRRGHSTRESVSLVHGKSYFKNIIGCRTSGCEMIQKTLVTCFRITLASHGLRTGFGSLRLNISLMHRKSCRTCKQKKKKITKQCTSIH